MPRMKILFITSTRLGDAILSTGILDAICRQWPQARVTVACGPLPASIFEGFSHVEKIIPMKKQKFHGHWVDLWKAVCPVHWDLVVDLRNSAVSRLVRSRKKAIFGPHIDQSLHKVEQAAQVVGFSEVPAPVLFFTPEQKAFAHALVPDAQNFPVIAVGPSANWIGKTWPAERFSQVLQWMTALDGVMPGARIAVFAAPAERAQALPVLHSIPEPQRIDGIGKGTPAQAAAAIALCRFYIGNDSGLMHAAAACGVPTLGLFGPSYPHLYRPWGDHTAIARTPQTFDELTDFEGYSAKILDTTLMDSLEISEVVSIIKRVFFA